MRDLLLEGLEVLDHLEVAASTGRVAKLLNCDQSSISRVYRYVNDKLGLNFTKNAKGHYQANTNQDILKKLREVSQKLRFQNNKKLRIAGQYWNESTLATVNELSVISEGWFGISRVLQCLRDRIIDLAVINSMDLGINALLSRPTAKCRWQHQDICGFTLLRYAIRPMAHRDHPLALLPRNPHLHELWKYPTLALPDDQFPVLSTLLKQQGMWQDRIRDDRYRQRLWEGKCKDRRSICYHTPLVERILPETLPLRPLNIDLGINDHEVVICLNEVATEPLFQEALVQIKQAYQTNLADDTNVTFCHDSAC